MHKREIKIVNRLGLHARASAKIVQLASRFTSNVALVFNGRRANARSIIAVMLLAASMDATIYVEANGPDEADAVSAIAELINDRFGEGS